MKRHGDEFFDRICELENIKKAIKMASKGKKKKYKEINKILKNADYYALKIQHMLITETYEITEKDYIEKIINEGNKKKKERRLMKLKFYPHRIIQWAVLLQTQHVLLKSFCYHTCACIPGGGIDRAHKLVNKYLTKYPNSTTYCLKIDVRKYYDSISHKILKEKLASFFKDARLLRLLGKIVDSYPGDRGIPIGSFLSQFFANFYLSDFDHYLKEKLRIPFVVRYMDDVVIFADDKEKLHTLLGIIKKQLDDLDLQLKPNYQIFPVEARGVDFVGFVFRHNGNNTLRRSTLLSIRQKTNELRQKETMTYADFCSLNSYLGTFQYFNSKGVFDHYLKPLLMRIFLFYAFKLVPSASEKRRCRFVKSLVDKRI